MSDQNEMGINTLYNIVLRETTNETIQEINPNFYTSVSDFIGKLKREEYDNIEAKIKDELVNITTTLTSLLLNIRLSKAKSSEKLELENLLDEEKFVLDGEEEIRERTEIILSATLNGRSRVLETISQKNKTKSLVVRFLKDIDQIVGADLEKYGPFRSEDVATLPYENAQALIAKKIVMKVRVED
jgi:DNA replication factor GINS